jgi:hypothetical protein
MIDEDTETAGVIALPPLIYAVPLVVGLVLNAVRPVAVAPRALARVVGLALIGAAVAVGVAAFAALRTAGRCCERAWGAGA